MAKFPQHDKRNSPLVSNDKISHLLSNQKIKRRSLPNAGTVKKFGRFSWSDSWLMLSLLQALIIAGYFFYLYTQPLEVLVLENDSPYTKEKLVAVDHKLSLAKVDSFAITEQLNQLPWVKTAKAKKFPPQVLGLIIEGRQPVALIQWPSAQFLISEDAVLIDQQIPSYYQGKLPRLILNRLDNNENLTAGVSIADLTIAWGLNWVKALGQNPWLPLRVVESIDISDPYKFIIKIKDANTKITVRYNDIESQIDRLKLASPYLEKARNWRTIDLRVKDRVIISK